MPPVSKSCLRSAPRIAVASGLGAVPSSSACAVSGVVSERHRVRTLQFATRWVIGWALLFTSQSAHAFIDVIPTLGRVISEARLIVVLQVERVDREKRIILYRVGEVLTNPDQVEVPAKIRHQIASGLHPRESKEILDWAQPGRTAVCFVNGKLAVTCIGDTWYESSELDPRSYVLVRGRSELSYAYSGSPELLRRHVAAILAKEEVTITAVRQGTPDNRAEEAVAFKQPLRGRDIPMWRIRASLKMPATVGEISSSPAWVVGIGFGDADDVAKRIADLKANDPALRRAAAETLGRIGRPAKPALPTLIGATSDRDPWVAVAAAGAVLSIDPRQADGIAALRKTIQAGDAGIRRAAVTACGDLGRGAKPFIDSLISAVGDPDAEVRWAAIESLGQCREAAQAAVPVLQTALRKPELRPVAVAALGMIGPAAKGAEADITAMLDDSDESIRWAAALALLRIDNRATERLVPLFLTALASSNPRTRWDAVWYFDHLHEPRSAVEGLIKLVANDDPGVRTSALLVLGNMGPIADGATAAIDHALTDRNLTVRSAAARAVPQMGIEDEAIIRRAAAVWADVFSQTDPPTPDWILWDAGHYLKKLGRVETVAEPTLRQLTSHPAAIVRRAALAALANLGSEAKNALPAATQCLVDADPRVRFTAARAVWEIGGAAEPVVVPLSMLLKTEEAQLRVEAAGVLKEIGPPARNAVPTLLACLDDHDPDVRLAAADAVWAIDRQMARVVPIFRAGLSDTDAADRQRAAKSLGEVGPSAAAALADLKAVLHDRDAQVRVAAASSIHAIDATDAAPLPVLTAALDDADDSIRQEAVETLARFGTEARPLLPAMHDMLLESNPELRFAAAAAILQLSKEDPDAIAAVVALFGDSDIDLRIRAVQLVGKLGPPARSAAEPLKALVKADNDALAAAAKDALAKVDARRVVEARRPIDSAVTEPASSDGQHSILIWAAAAAALVTMAVIASRLAARWRAP